MHALRTLTPLLCATTTLVGQGAPRLGGYLQARETYQSNVGLTGTINRARASADGTLPAHFSYRLLIEYEAGGSATTAAGVSLRDAYIKWQSAAFGITAGQFKTPFSREFLTSITVLETADRATVVDSLAPKRDIGLMGEYKLGVDAGLAIGVFNGGGQNIPANRDSSVLVVARATARPFSVVSLSADVARYNTDSVRYGADASVEWEGAILRGEYIEQQRAGVHPMDWGWLGLAAYRVVPWLEVVVKREEFERPAIGAAQYNAATTGGVNVEWPGGRTRLVADYVSRRIGAGAPLRRVLITQLQVRF